MERLEQLLNEMKLAIDNDSVITLVCVMDEMEALQGKKFLSVVLERFAPVINEESLIYYFVKACNEPEEKGGEV